jgi:hypothetical protein
MEEALELVNVARVHRPLEGSLRREHLVGLSRHKSRFRHATEAISKW